jgi:nucleotide-binding universal stress UspA family protein
MIPPRAVLAALSFSEPSRVALVLAARLARHCGADLHVLYVEDPLLDAAARHVGIDLARHTERELLRFISDAWPAVLCSPQVHVVAGADVDVILEVAHRQAADLIVIDGARISGAETFFFGSRTEGLLRRADVSLLVAPAEWSPPHPDAADLADLGPVIALVDMSDKPSLAATRAAGELASVLGTSVEVEQIAPGVAMPTTLTKHLAGDASGGADRAPMVVLGTHAPSSRRGRTAALVNRVLASATVPILLYVAEQIAQL